MSDKVSLLYTVLLVAIYFVPTLNAHLRKHHNENAILVLNFFLGWTILGWVVALVWSSTVVRSPAPEVYRLRKQP
jgi:hypothetical protein